MNDGPKEGFAFIVDTDSYAGNFEREMTAFVTGQIGECEVGKEIIQEDFDYGGFSQIVYKLPADNGCYRPTAIWEVEYEKDGRKPYNAVAMFLNERPSAEMLELMKSRVALFPAVFSAEDRMAEFNRDKPLINISGFRLLEFKSVINSEEI